MADANSILLSIKKLLGLTEDYDSFDQDLIIHINSVFASLNQMGVGPESGFAITGSNEIWNDFFEYVDEKLQNSVKSYVYLKVRMLFDPPTSSVQMNAIENMAKEYEWRLYVLKGGY